MNQFEMREYHVNLVSMDVMEYIKQNYPFVDNEMLKDIGATLTRPFTIDYLAKEKVQLNEKSVLDNLG